MPELEELQRLFHEAVLVTGPYAERYVRGGFPVAPFGERPYRPRQCWFQANIPGIDPCDGDHGPDALEAAHWIKRQRVELAVAAYFFGTEEAANGVGWEIKDLAGWDPRNAVPACEKHHRRFDAHRMPTLIVPRRLVPEHVVEFANDYGLETALEDRNPEEVYGAPE